jgi:hypothetical protein
MKKRSKRRIFLHGENQILNKLLYYTTLKFGHANSGLSNESEYSKEPIFAAAKVKKYDKHYAYLP